MITKRKGGNYVPQRTIVKIFSYENHQNRCCFKNPKRLTGELNRLYTYHVLYIANYISILRSGYVFFCHGLFILLHALKKSWCWCILQDPKILNVTTAQGQLPGEKYCVGPRTVLRDKRRMCRNSTTITLQISVQPNQALLKLGIHKTKL